jgi:DNA-binding YbaB/EbfC family protein
LFEGLKNLGNIGSMIKQAQEMGSKLQGLKDELRVLRTQGAAGADMVVVEINGLCEILSCRIDPSLLKPDDREMLEDLVVAAVNQAISKAKDLHGEAIQKLTDGMSFPGMKDILDQVKDG